VNKYVAKDYARLSTSGKIRRVSKLAAAAMSQYNISVRSMRLYCFATNLLYEVQSNLGERFILRMAFPGWRTLEDLRSEAAWLAALHEDTDIGAPLVIPALSGAWVLPMTGLGVPDIWYATLMTWINGRLLGHYLTSANLERMGELFARLHIHGKRWLPLSEFTGGSRKSMVISTAVIYGLSIATSGMKTSSSIMAGSVPLILRIPSGVSGCTISP
jgi:Ser/Thr protein kinase RdoA (MazF antagonist)